MAKFYPYEGDLMGLSTNENHNVLRWSREDCKVLISITRLGDAISFHFASDKRGLRHLPEGIEDLVTMCAALPWCNRIIGAIKRDSICRLVIKCGFKQIAYNDEKKTKVYERLIK